MHFHNTSSAFDPLVLFLLLLNQQFNDNFKKQGYHDINDKNKE